MILGSEHVSEEAGEVSTSSRHDGKEIKKFTHPSAAGYNTCAAIVDGCLDSVEASVEKG